MISESRVKKGFTLVELMMAVSILTIAIVVMVKSFGYISKAIQISKNTTIAANLAQEKMQIITQKSYYMIIPTMSPLYLTDFNPQVPYDNTYFPPEVVLEAGVYYTRYTYIEVIQEDSGNIVVLSPNTPDTGMKQITVTVVWNEGSSKKKYQIKNIISNPNTVMANSVFTGVVKDSTTFALIPYALVNMAENMGYRDTTGLDGKYTINAMPGNYTMYVNAYGYFPVLKTVSIAANQTQTNDFYLIKMASGTISGYPWIRDHLVISQVVGSTVSAGWDQEYVEIFNPTTYTWTVNGNIGLKYQRIYDDDKKNISINYITNSISSGGFYLFANTGTINAGGISRTADAVWSDTNSISDFPDFSDQKNIIRVFDEGGDEGGGALELYRISDGKTLDQVGWNRNDSENGKKDAPFYETSPIPQNRGLERGELYARYSSTNGISTSYGPAYDSNNNSIDFYDYSSISIVPRNSAITLPVISATPADGAIITCSDGLSSPTTAYLTGSPPYAYFNLVNVATGTWTVLITSSSYLLQNDTVTITNGSNFVFGSTYSFLDSSAIYSYVTGQVLNTSYMPISPAIKVTNSENETYAKTTDGKYILQVSPGENNIVANPDNLNPNYVSISSNNVYVDAGEIKSGVDFILYPGGRISGFITRDGVNALPGIAIIISDTAEITKDQQISGLDGRFTSNVLSLGTYVIDPVVDSKSSVNPSSYTVTISLSGKTYFSSTYTVTNALGYISGSVKYQSAPVKTGALIVVTTKTITSPPDLNTSLLSGIPYYITSSNEEGNYLAEVRQSTNPKYNVYAFYTLPNQSGYSIISATQTNISVLAGSTTYNVNFSW